MQFDTPRLFEVEPVTRPFEAPSSPLSELLIDATEALTSSQDVARVFELIGEGVRGVTRRGRVVVGRLDGATQVFTTAVCIGQPRVPKGAAFDLGLALGSDGTSLLQDRSAVIDLDAVGPSAWVARDNRYGHGLALFVPLERHERFVGALIVDDPATGRVAFRDREVRLVETLAAQAAMVLENIGLADRLAERARTLEALGVLGSIIASTLDLDDVLSQIADYGCALLDADGSAILILDTHSDDLRVRAQKGFSRDFESQTLSAQAALRLYNKGIGPLTIDDLTAHPDAPPLRACATEGLVSVVLSPIYLDSELHGMLLLGYRRHVTLTPDDELALRLFTAQAATAIKNAERYEAEHVISQTLQSALTRVPEKLDGIEFAHLYRSATEAARVGGDFYDIYDIDGRRLVLLVGDVSGKGIQAASLTAVVRNTIRAYAEDPGSTPGDVLARTNEIVHKSSESWDYVTVFLGELDRETGVLSYSAGGHPPAMILRTSGELTRLEVANPAVGAFSGLAFVTHREHLAPGDMFIGYTDGVTEARRDGDLFGDERLAETVLTLGDRRCDEVARQLYDRILDHSRGMLCDDVAILTLRLKAEKTGAPAIVGRKRAALS